MTRRVLITGVAGFLGSHLLDALLERDLEVVGLDDLSQGTEERLAHVAGSGLRFELVRGDVRDLELVQRVARGVSQIVHLAEAKLPRYGGAMETLEVNTTGTANVLEAARDNGAHVFLGSTAEVYGKSPEPRLHEESPLVVGQTQATRWSLGVSKMMAEQLCFAYAEAYELPITVLRYFEAYGPRQAPDWRGGPQSVFVSAAIEQRPIPIHGDGLQTRTFGAVQDLVAATCLAMESPYARGEIFNISGNDTIAMINLAYLIWRLVGHPRKPELEFVPYTDFAAHYDDPRSRRAEIAKARYLLGYEPQVELSRGLRQTIQWHAAELGVDLRDS